MKSKFVRVPKYYAIKPWSERVAFLISALGVDSFLVLPLYPREEMPK
jgi:hypothetical protein